MHSGNTSTCSACSCVPGMPLSVSHAEQGSAWADYLSPWELDERRGGLIAASCRGLERERRESGQRMRKEGKER